jgi:hypothetical protein
MVRRNLILARGVFSSAVPPFDRTGGIPIATSHVNPCERHEMKIDCYFSEGCASQEALKANLENARMLEGIHAEVSCRVVTEEDARRLRIPGSPTLRMDGEDLDGIRVLEGSVS